MHRRLERWKARVREVLSPLKLGAAPTDADLVFFMPVFKDHEPAFKSLARLRAAYPTSRVIVLSDGDEDFPGAEAARLFDVEYRLGENLYAARFGGQMIQRFLEAYLEAPGKALVRLDSDARIDRRFQSLPQGPGVFGRIGGSGIIQGGCVLITHEACTRFVEQKTFLSEELLDAEASWGKLSAPENLQKKIETGRIAYDKVLHWGAVKAGVPVRAFEEIFAVWKPKAQFREALENRQGRFAIVHPDKMESEPMPMRAGAI